MKPTQEYYSQYNTGRSDALIAEAQAIVNTAWETDGGEITESFFLNLAARISEKNVNKDGTGKRDFSNIEGGPFAAIIVRYEGGLDENGKGIGKPEIIGIGANHVVPENDPSAHGEMSAIRDAGKRLGHTDFSDAIMFSSCECCPQCQAAVTGSGIQRLIFANDRFQAADIGFSDEEQYRLLETMQRSISSLHDAQLPLPKEKVLELLGEHDAMVLDGKGRVIAYGDAHMESDDPMETLPSMNAIRAACKKEGHFHLPEDTTLVTRHVIHPVSFTTADWARIGRVRDKSDPSDPEKDRFEKDANRIVHIHDTSEEMMVRQKDGTLHLASSAADIIGDVCTDVPQRSVVSTERSTDGRVLRLASSAFEAWKELTGQNAGLKY